MRYEIRSNNDFATGSCLNVCIPENEVDYCVLNTLQSDCPDFILPFCCKSIDGQMDFTYKIGTLSKLTYFSGEFSAAEYIKLWTSLLEPLIDCRDWFMKPYSFVLNVDYLFFDKHRKKVRYLYIPSVAKCSNHISLSKMMANFSGIITVSDTKLENILLRAIVGNSPPADIVKALKTYSSDNDATRQSPVQIDNPFGEIRDDESLTATDREPKMRSGTAVPMQQSTVKKQSGDFYNAASYLDSAAEASVYEKEPTGLKIFGKRGKRKKADLQDNENKIAVDVLPLRPPKPAVTKIVRHTEATQSTPIIDSGTGLKYVGVADFPEIIQVGIERGDIFTIGRYDSSVGKKQSNFEFDRKTKAVSRRHAVIERDENCYKIIDLSSSAGTFINSQKLPPNTPYELEAGTRISFGNLGADYVWEVS